MMVGESFAKSLKASGLTGFGVRNAVKINENYSGITSPKLLLFEFTGKGGFCHRFKVKGAANLCPHCKSSQVICDYCGTVFDNCPSCGRKLVGGGLKERVADLFVFEGRPKTLVVANQDWDGSDVFGVHGPGGGVFVTSRARIGSKKHMYLRLRSRRLY